MALLAAAGVLTGCGLGGLFGRGPECAPIGYLEGISLDIKPSSGAGVASAALEACWDGKCRDFAVELSEARDTITGTCSGSEPDDACGVTAGPPTGGWHGFAEIDGLPAKPVKVSVTLSSAAGKVLLDKQITVTPKRPEPVGGTCGGGDKMQTGIVVDAGELRERT
jgi:hypothetical protein